MTLSLVEHETLDDLARHLRSLRATDVDIREALLAELDAVVAYDDANEWARAVRACEALAILGWGQRERVDAISFFDGDHWVTQFITERRALRFRKARWLHRSAGWCLFHPEFHASPDRPDLPARSWRVEAERQFPLVDVPRLASQRNCQHQMPIYFVTEGDPEPAGSMTRALAQFLAETVRPNAYGDGLGHFNFTTICGEPRAATSTLTVGAYHAQHARFSCELLAGDDLLQTSRRARREVFAKHLLSAIDELGDKLRSRAVRYDVASLRADVERAIATWIAASPP